MDLSKFLVKINYESLLPKLQERALSNFPCYLSNYRERVKINYEFISWKDLIQKFLIDQYTVCCIWIQLNNLFFLIQDTQFCRWHNTICLRSKSWQCTDVTWRVVGIYNMQVWKELYESKHRQVLLANFRFHFSEFILWSLIMIHLNCVCY